MKKKTSWYLLAIMMFISVSMVLSSCSKSNAFSPIFLIDENGIYSGFSEVSDSISVVEAASLGYVAITGQKIAENSDIWESFVKEAARGINSSVRLVKFFANESVYIIDVFFNNGQYYLFDNSVENQNTKGFAYLLKLEGTFGMPAKQTIAFILADDKSLTFDQYMTAMFSSSTEVIQSVQPSRMIMLLFPES